MQLNILHCTYNILYLQSTTLHTAAEWLPMYAPSKDEAEEHRAKAYADGVPHGG